MERRMEGGLLVKWVTSALGHREPEVRIKLEVEALPDMLSRGVAAATLPLLSCGGGPVMLERSGEVW